MPHQLSLAHLTLVDADPPALVEAAAGAGFRSTGIRLRPARPGEAPWPMHPGSPMLRETLSRINDRGVRVHDIEIVRLNPEFDAASLDPVLEASQQLGAKWLMVNCDDDDLQRSASHLGSLCERAARHGMQVGVEFMLYTALPTLDAACALVRAAGHPAARVVIDSLHLFRSGATADDLTGRPEIARDFAQLNDAPTRAHWATSPAEEGRSYRLFPGEGALPLRGVIDQLTPGAVLSIESPCSVRRANLPPAERARLAMQSTLQWLRTQEMTP